MFDGLQVPEEDGGHVLAGGVEEHRGGVEIDLPVVGVPTEAHCDGVEGLGQVHDAALLHGERDLLPRGGVREERPDDLGQRRQDVHEVLPLLRGHLDDPKRPAPRLGPEHGGHDVNPPPAALKVPLGELGPLGLLKDVQLAVANVTEAAAAVGGKDEDQQRHLLGDPIAAHPDHLVDARARPGGLVAGVRDRPHGLEVVVVGAVDDRPGGVHHDALQVDVDGAPPWRRVP
mmetsp:Transcript_107385/g.300734  ORF Transcript_107385/g.300734 Transcript_107385/m.300734 type:complete len:230 (+) Transcript_107385:455-1144(+)